MISNGLPTPISTAAVVFTGISCLEKGRTRKRRYLLFTRFGAGGAYVCR